jgi:Rad3-related DNA helicase
MALDMSEKEMVELGLKWEQPRWTDAPGMQAWIRLRSLEIKDSLSEANDEIKGLVSVIRTGMFTRIRALSKKVQKLEKIQLKIDRYEKSNDRGVEWVSEIEDDSILLEPVEAGRFANAALLKFGEFRLFMSATIFNDGKPLIRGLRLKRSETKYVSVGSSFPTKNRPVYQEDVGDLGYKKYRENSSSMMAAIKRIMAERPDVRGIIHCTSYELAEKIGENIGGQRLVSHGSKDRGQVLDKFLAGGFKRDSVLLAVSVTQGYDFKYDLCRFQIIPKIPYPYPSKRIVARKEVDPEYYDWRTALARQGGATGRRTTSVRRSCSTQGSEISSSGSEGCFLAGTSTQSSTWRPKTMHISSDLRVLINEDERALYVNNLGAVILQIAPGLP